MKTYERISSYKIEEVLPFIHNQDDPNCKNPKIREYDGKKVNMGSQRLKVFARSLKCVKCGVQGTMFALERHIGHIGNDWHLNLYGVNVKGQEVLMTKDHIIPVSKGGKDSLGNLQTMCTKCNVRKGNGGDIYKQENPWKSDDKLKHRRRTILTQKWIDGITRTGREISKEEIQAFVTGFNMCFEDQKSFSQVPVQVMLDQYKVQVANLEKKVKHYKELVEFRGIKEDG